MDRKPILVIANDERSYHALTLPGEEIKFIPTEKYLDPTHDFIADLILLDVSEKAGRGLELLKKIKTETPGIPVIFVSNARSGDDAAWAFRLGARDYFRKPFQCRELQRVVERYLRFKRTPRRRRPPSSKEDNFFSPAPDATDPREPGRISHVVNYIRNNISKDLSLERLAREACISKYHFCKVFKKHTGMSPRQFVLRQRLERAKSLLSKDSYNISQAALEAGFNDLCNFSKEFKRRTGLTPTAYKSTHMFDARLRITSFSSPNDA